MRREGRERRETNNGLGNKKEDGMKRKHGRHAIQRRQGQSYVNPPQPEASLENEISQAVHM